jgi:hypothetical protein
MEVLAIRGYVIPLFGNQHSQPYGDLLVSDGRKKSWRKMKEDDDGVCYITFHRQRFLVRNIGSLYHPVFRLEEFHGY